MYIVSSAKKYFDEQRNLKIGLVLLAASNTMGIVASRPYIIDEFDSDDEKDAYESAVDYTSDSTVSNTVSPSDETDIPSSSAQEQLENPALDVEEDQEKPFASRSSVTSLRGLDELLKLIECHDFEGAQKVAYNLRDSQMFSNNCVAVSASIAQLAKSAESSSITSTWPSKTQDDVTYKLSCDSELRNQISGDFNDVDQRKVLIKLDEELNQFEANEEKIVSEAPVFHSAIPRLKSMPQRTGTSTGICADVSRKPKMERKRSPSPLGSRSSGIPRYSWTHMTPSAASVVSVESKTDEQTLDASSMSNTLESLPEISDRVHTSTSKSSFINEQSESCVENDIVKTNETTGNAPAININMSELTGRVKIKKKHSGLPSLWTKTDETQDETKTKDLNLPQLGLSSSLSSDMATDEILACRTIGECGNPSERKVLDLKRWYCISRPQYKTSCGISAVVSCWNYLFSTMGHGSLKPVTQESAMKLLGFVSPFDSINFGPVTGNRTVMRWFGELNSHFKVSGQSFIMYKPSGKNQTLDTTDQMALGSLKKGLKDPNMTFIYHCHNHYFCPIGYEDTSQFCVDAYKGDIGGNVESWVIIADSSRKYSSLLCQSWEQICVDLNCKSPSYFNIRQSWKGVAQRKNIKTIGENLHCIIALQKVNENVPASPTSVSSSTSTSSSLSASRPSRLPNRSQSPKPTLSPGLRSAVDTQRPELGNDFPVDVEEEEVGYENLDSDENDDDINENGSSVTEGQT